MGISKIWEIAKIQIDPKEKVGLINEQLHTTPYYSTIPHYLCEDFLHQKDPKNLIKCIQSVCTWNYFGTGFNETNALSGKLPLTNATIAISKHTYV